MFFLFFFYSSSTSTSLIESTISSESVSIGHHRLPEKFNPPPDYIQPNDKTHRNIILQSRKAERGVKFRLKSSQVAASIHNVLSIPRNQAREKKQLF